MGVIYTEVWNTKGRCKTVGWGFTKGVPLSEGSTDVLPGNRMTIILGTAQWLERRTRD